MESRCHCIGKILSQRRLLQRHHSPGTRMERWPRMGSKVPRKMRYQGRERPAGRMRPFGGHVRTGRIPIRVNLLSSLTTRRVLQGELGYDQFVILVVARQALQGDINWDGLRGTGRARTGHNSGTARRSFWTCTIRRRNGLKINL